MEHKNNGERTTRKMSLRAIHQRISTALTPRHREIMRRILLGDAHKAIAADMGITPGRIAQIVSSPLFIAECERMQAVADAQTFDAMKEMRGLQSKAVAVIKNSMDNEDMPHLAFKAAREVLDRTGVAVPKQLHLTQDSMSFEQRLMEVRMRYSEAPDTEERHELEYESPIRVMGSTDLSTDDGSDDDEDDDE